MYRKTYIEIDVDNLKYNVREIIKHYKGYKYYFGVVKSNCYGHGIKTAKYLVESGINYLVVSSLEEAISIRNDNKSIPILCVEPIRLEYINECIKYNITITVHDISYFKELLKTNLPSKLNFHLKIDSGMSRLGILSKDEFNYIYKNYRNNKMLFLEGIFTHFATSGICDKEWDNQLKNFISITSDIDLDTIPIVHLGNSISLVSHKKIPFANGVRLGLIMYGYIKDNETSNNLKNRVKVIKRNIYSKMMNLSPVIKEIPIQFKPAFSLYSEVMQIKLINKGTKVSYGAKYCAKKDTYIAIIPIGYADGIRKNCVGLNVLINNRLYPIIGDICMGMLMIEIDNSVKLFDRVTLIGNEASIFSMSKQAGTIVYDILCGISPFIPRNLISNGKVIEEE